MSDDEVVASYVPPRYLLDARICVRNERTVSKGEGEKSGVGKCEGEKDIVRKCMRKKREKKNSERGRRTE